MAPSTPALYILFCVAIVLVLKEVNSIVWEPYMVSRHSTVPLKYEAVPYFAFSQG